MYAIDRCSLRGPELSDLPRCYRQVFATGQAHTTPRTGPHSIRKARSNSGPRVDFDDSNLCGAISASGHGGLCEGAIGRADAGVRLFYDV